jgi:iron complex outermembrane receptor protein
LNANEFSQELQLYGDAMNNRLHWITGAYYYRLSGNKLSYTAAFGALQPPTAKTVSPSGPYAINKSYSAFAQLTYEVTPQIRITGGLRYVKDDREATWHDHTTVRGQIPGPFLSCLMANAPGATRYEACTLERSVSYNYVPWTVGLDYKPTDDVLLYAKVSKGYRSGAFTSTAPASTASAAQNAFLISTFGPVAPERLLSPEVGSKVELFDHRLRINGAVYYSNYANIQLQTNIPADPSCTTCVPVNLLQNSGAAHIWGGELEMAALIGGLRLDASLGITRPKYVKGPNVGFDLVNVSKTNWSLGAAYPIDTGLGVLTPSVNYAWRSRQTFFTLAAGAPSAALDAVSQRSYGLLDTRVSFDLTHIPLTLAIYGQNLANTKYAVSATNFAAPIGLAVNWPGPPRTYGVSAQYRF